MLRKLFSIFAVLFIISLISAPICAAEITVFGPNQYLRTTGAPNIYTDTFSAIPKEGKLIITNGDEDGNHRVSSAKVLVNREELFGTNDFNQQIYHLEAPLNLAEDNSITVELRSGPGVI